MQQNSLFHASLTSVLVKLKLRPILNCEKIYCKLADAITETNKKYSCSGNDTETDQTAQFSRLIHFSVQPKQQNRISHKQSFNITMQCKI